MQLWKNYELALGLKVIFSKNIIFGVIVSGDLWRNWRGFYNVKGVIFLLST